MAHSETPPYTWGRLFIREGRYGIEGNTPIYTGKTKSTIALIGEPKKHPHIHGEDQGFSEFHE